MRLLSRNGHVDDLTIPEYVPEVIDEDIDEREIPTLGDSDSDAEDAKDNSSGFMKEIQACNDRLMQEADDYDMTQSPHRGSRSFIQSTPAISSSSSVTTSTSAITDLARSDADLPLVTDEARHGEVHNTTSPGSDPPKAKPVPPASGCCSVGQGLDMCPLFKNGGDLGGFERNGWKPMPCPMVIDSGAAETVIPTSWFTDHAIRETEASKNGVYYTTANGVKVYNKGEKTRTMCHFEAS